MNRFIKFALRKVSFYLVAAFVVLTLVFIIPHLCPVSPIDVVMAKIGGIKGTTPAGFGGGSGGGMSAEKYLEQMLKTKFGAEKPLLTKYGLFWERILTLDFGYSFSRFPASISSLICTSLPWTFALVLPVIPIGYVIGNYMGSRAAFMRGRLDNFFYIIAQLSARAPYYWFAILAILIFGIKLGWFPISGAVSDTWTGPTLSLDYIADAAYHYILPLLSIIPIGLGNWIIGMRAMSIYEMESDYINYSRQLGFREGKLRKYVEENAVLPNFNQIPIILKWLITNTLLVEIVFGYPGIGLTMYKAAVQMDYPLLQACFIIIVLIVMGGNFIIDILNGIIDPRIGSGYVSE